MIVRLRHVASRWWPIGAALVVVAVAAGIAVAGTREPRLQASPGDVVYSYLNTSELSTDTIRLPYGVVTVGVTDARTEVEDSTFDDREPPEDGSWVGVFVGTVPSDPLPSPSDSPGPGRPHPSVVVELVAGGRSYVVPSDALDGTDADFYPAQRRAWVAVAGRPEDLRVAITYDGVRQSVRPSDGTRTTGRAAPLYELPTENVSSSSAIPPQCGTVRYPASFGPADKDFTVRCELVAYPALPYLSQLGWAPKGYRWLAFGIKSDKYPSFRYRVPNGLGVEYSILRDPVLRVSLDAVNAVGGRASTPTLLTDETQISPGGLAVFRVPATASPHRLEVSATWADLDSDGGPPPAGAPVAPDVTVTWTREIR